MIKTKREAEKQYLDYITSHIKNVKVAFDEVVKCDKIMDDFGNHRNDAKFEEILNNKFEVHDRSKFNSMEFNQYREMFYPCEEDNTPISKIKDNFNSAWNNHYTNNSHHPEYWCKAGRDYNCGLENSYITMPDECIIEMICDWISVSMTKHSNFIDWWNNPNGGKDEKSKMLQPDVIKKLDGFIIRNASKLDFSK